MLKVSTDCTTCAHEKVCRKNGVVESMKNKLANTNYGKGPNDDYDWNIISEHNGIDICFKCKNYDPDYGYLAKCDYGYPVKHDYGNC